MLLFGYNPVAFALFQECRTGTPNFLSMEIVLPANFDEEDLIRACARNERWAQQVLYEEYYGRMMVVCLRYANNEEDALDILHEAFIKVFQHINRYQPGTSLTAWIRRIIVNTAIDYYRKSIRRRTEDIDQAGNLTNGCLLYTSPSPRD